MSQPGLKDVHRDAPLGSEKRCAKCKGLMTKGACLKCAGREPKKSQTNFPPAIWKSLNDVLVEKFNPYHDERGRFSTGPGGGGGAATATRVGGKAPKGKAQQEYEATVGSNKTNYFKANATPEQREAAGRALRKTWGPRPGEAVGSVGKAPPVAYERALKAGVATPWDNDAVRRTRELYLEGKSTHEIPDDAVMENGETRGAFRKRIIDELYASETPRREYKALILVGITASGKTTFGKKAYKELGARLNSIDNDQFKKKIPEFEEGVGAVAVHREAGIMADAVLDRAMKNGDNLVMQTLSKSPGSLAKDIDLLTRAGYKDIEVIEVQVSPEVSSERAMKRYERSGGKQHLVDPLFILTEVGTRPVESMDQFLTNPHPEVKSVERYSGEVPFGTPPKLLSRYDRDKDRPVRKSGPLHRSRIGPDGLDGAHRQGNRKQEKGKTVGFFDALVRLA